MSHTMYATFTDASLAEKAVGALMDHGVRNEDISVISQDTNPKHANGHNRDHRSSSEAGHGLSVSSADDDKGNGIPANHIPEYDDHAEKAGKTGLSTTTAGDAEAGAAKGASIGLGLGVAAAVASIIIPGFGLVLGGGALATAVAGTLGATAAGAVAGGVTGYLRDQGVPGHAATDYERAYNSGCAVLTVHVPSGKVSQLDIENILSKYHATYIHSYSGMVH